MVIEGELHPNTMRSPTSQNKKFNKMKLTQTNTFNLTMYFHQAAHVPLTSPDSLNFDKLLHFVSTFCPLPCFSASGSRPRSLCVLSGAVEELRRAKVKTGARKEGGQMIKCTTAQALRCQCSVRDGGSRPCLPFHHIPALALTSTPKGERQRAA